MHVNLSPSNLDRTCRIGQEKASSNKPKAVIIKFISYNKKVLKGTQVSITESLTAKRMGILKEAREKHQFQNLWTRDGKMLYKDGNDNIVKLYCD